MKKSTEGLYIGVIGERFCTESIGEIAFEIGCLLAKQGWILVCGGMGGVMEKACQGSFTNGGITIGILPGSTRREANPFLSYSIVTALGESRNSIVVRSCDAIVAISGSHGTLSEIAFANLFQIPIVGINTWEFPASENQDRRIDIARAENPQAAIELLKGNV